MQFPRRLRYPFKVAMDGSFTTLYQFCAQDTCNDGYAPSQLVQASDGNLYGTTTYGGSYSAPCDQGCGTVFRISPSGTLTTLHSFDYDDGANPLSELVQADDGNLYGTASGGGDKGTGTLFKIGLDGSFTDIHHFCGIRRGGTCLDGRFPYGALTQGRNGDLYGTTFLGGAGACDGVNGCGTVFRFALDGSFLTLHVFTEGDGIFPEAGLVQGSDGNFYGTTIEGGNQAGTAFQITPLGVFSVLHTFCADQDCTDGIHPPAEMYQATNGAFYSVTPFNDDGEVFSVSVGLLPFVKTLPLFGSVGTPITILGSNLSGALSVTFNGVAAAFTLVSGTEITTAVPPGATTGPVLVKSTVGTVRSSGPFHVSE